MPVDLVQGDPALDAVLDMQRELSQARTADEMFIAFSSHLHHLVGATHLLGLDVRDLPPGEFRISDQIDLINGDLQRHAERWRARCELSETPCQSRRSAVLSPLLESPAPKSLRELDPDDDEVLATMFSGAMDCLAAPIYYGGEVRKWLLVFRSPGEPLTMRQVSTGVANLNLFARSLQQMELSTRVDALNAKLHSEIAKIGRVQRSLLPSSVPCVECLEVAMSYEPCDAAGGDYYDYQLFGDEKNRRVGFVIADVSGHGPAAAVVMAMMRTILNTFRMFGADPANVVPDVNRLLRDGLVEGTFVTAFFVVIDPRTGQASYANAGHNPPRLRRADGTIESIDHDSSYPLGVTDEMESRGHEFTMQPGDTLLLYTDGITEAMNFDDNLFGVSRLDAAVARSNGASQDVIDEVIMAVQSHEAGRPRTDDQCLLAVRYHGAQHDCANSN